MIKRMINLPRQTPPKMRRSRKFPTIIKQQELHLLLRNIRQYHLLLHQELGVSHQNQNQASQADAPSERPKRATAGPVDYRALNDPWAKGNKRGFAARANRVHIESDTPQTVEEARTSPDWEQWKLAFRSEIDAHTKNNTFTLGTPPPNRRILPTRWVTTIKRGPQGEVIKYKARWVCKGFR